MGKAFRFSGLFRYSPPPQQIIPPPPPVESVAAATSGLSEYVFCESVDSAHISQISSTFQEADCLLKLVKVNKQVFAITIKQKLEPYCAGEHQLGGEDNNFVSRARGEITEKTQLFFLGAFYECLRSCFRFFFVEIIK